MEWINVIVDEQESIICGKVSKFRGILQVRCVLRD
jgi:hypothetical protein